MERLNPAVVALVLLTVSVSAVPTAAHRPPKDLSDEPHYVGDDQAHNSDYDHEAFLGKEEAKTFDQLSPAEAKKRLGIIVKKIDKNGDGNVDEDELVDWVRRVARRYVYDDVERHWGNHDQDGDGKILWEGYKESAFGMVKNLDDIHDPRRGLTFNQAIERYRKRFILADHDGDKFITKEEFADFLHPHDVPHMREVVLDEAMWDMDKNKDGFVDFDEYVKELWHEQEGEEPEWLEVEKKSFYTHRDKNGDKKLDKEEVGNWVSPQGFDNALSEAKHLIYEGDRDKDKVLSKSEILDNQDLFVGSQATEFGKLFVRHDEF